MHGEWFGIVLLIFQIWATIDCVRNAHNAGGYRFGWIALIWLVPFGVVAYYIWGRRRWRAASTPFVSNVQPEQPASTVYYQPPERSYQEGYRPEQPPVEQRSAGTVEWQQYEQPQASYPEMTQEQAMRSDGPTYS